MPTHSIDTEIQSRIQSFLAELSAMVKRQAIEAVNAALGVNGAAPVRRGPGRPRGSGKRGPGRPPKAAASKSGRRVRRSAQDLEALGQQVLTHVRANPGHRLEEIGVGLRTDTAILKRPIQNLLASKQLRTEGQKRGTKYFAGGGRGGAGKGASARNARGGRKGKRGRKAA